MKKLLVWLLCVAMVCQPVMALELSDRVEDSLWSNPTIQFKRVEIPSPTAEQIAAEEAKIPKLVNLRVISMTEDSVKIAWKYSEGYGYQLAYTTDESAKPDWEDGKWTNGEHDDKDYFATIKGLTAGQTYYIYVRYAVGRVISMQMVVVKGEYSRMKVSLNPVPTLTPVPTDAPTATTRTIGDVVYNVKSTTATVIGPASKTATTVTIPTSIGVSGKKYKVTAISKAAFKGMTSLKSVVIGKNVETIGKQAFYGCSKLKTISIKTKKLKSVDSKAFKGIYKKATVKCPSGMKATYKKLLQSKGMNSTVTFK